MPDAMAYDGATVTSIRVNIHRLGWRPTPVASHDARNKDGSPLKSAGKRPMLPDWRTISAAADEETIISWSGHRDCNNTGILTGLSGGGIVAVDVDVDNPEVSTEIQDLCREMLGETLCREGRSPKAALVYRIREDVRKIETPELFFLDGSKAQIEILAEGQQFVGFGIHPDTRKPYTWTRGSPLDTPVNSLPIVGREELEAFAAAAETILRSHGAAPKEKEKKAPRKDRATGAAAHANAAGGETYFERVNATALGNLGAWVEALFPGIARYQEGTGAYRIRSEDLRRDFEEDIGIHPGGIHDFGPRKPMSPIDLVMEHGGAADCVQAAHWLCEKMGITPETLGWRDRRQRRPGQDEDRDAAKQAYADTQRRQAEPAPAAPPSTRSEIRIVGGELPRVVDEAEAALLAAEAPVFQRGSMLVGIGRTVIKTRDTEVIGPRIVPLTTHAVVEHMTKSGNFVKYDGRKEDWVPTDCPAKVAETYLARSQWRLRSLAGIIEAPTMRCDGSILDQPGYDPASGLMLIGHVDMPRIPDRPTKDQARAALRTLKEPIAGFPFVSDADRAVALSGMLTAVTRRAYGAAPLHAVTAPTAGSGKGKIVDLISVMATGRPAPVLSPGKTEEEAEKRLGSALISGDPVISIDNLEQPLGGELLCTCLTQPIMKIRVLGLSLNVEVPSIAAMFATGNNMTIMGDMTRRTLVCTVDPGCERPELREFEFDPVAMVAQDRGKYIAAVLTILRAYVVAGFPDRPRTLGSFEDWSDHVRGALLWLGEADPIETMEQARESDPKLSALRAVIGAWSDVLGHDQQVTAASLIKTATAVSSATFGGAPEYQHDELREALLTVAGVGASGAITSRSLGKWLKAHSGRVVNGLRIIICHDDGHNATRYRLEKVKSE